MVEISDREELERWLRDKPREWSAVIAARAALRVAPMLATALGSLGGGASKMTREIVLPSFRGMAASWVAGTWPVHGVEVRAAARAAANAVVRVRRGAGAAAAADAADAAAYAVATTDAADVAANAAAAVVAGAYAASVSAGFADIWAVVSRDASELDARIPVKRDASELARQSLWFGEPPRRVMGNWIKLKKVLLDRDNDWEVWTDWYDARLRGDAANEDLELARVMIDDEIWAQGPKVVNAYIKELIAQYTTQLEPDRKPGATRAELAEVVSPAPSLSPDELLDAGPNAVYDAPDASLDLPNLPIRQRALIQAILDGLPTQAPKHLKSTLEKYDGELLVRGVQPILGLLNDMAGIVAADIGDANARREWLAAGIAVAFGKFLENHDLFAKHFPLDLKRDELYARTAVDEDAATGSALAKPFEDVAKATVIAHGAGLTTDDFLKIVAGLAEFAKVTSTLPQAKSDDIGAKKRTVLTGIGFLERVYNILGTTVTLVGTSEGAQLLAVVTTALEALSRLLH